MEFETNVKLKLESEESDSEEVDGEAVYVSNRERYLKEVSETVFRTESESGTDWAENVAFELKGLKLAYDTSFLEASEAILLALLDIVPEGDMAHLKQICKKWSPLLDRFLNGPNRADDEVELLFKLQEYCETHTKQTVHFESIVKTLYTVSIISSKAITTWAEEQEDAEGETDINIAYICKGLVTWLTEKEYEAGVFTSDTDDESPPINPSPAIINKVESKKFKKEHENSEKKAKENRGSFYSDDDFGSEEDTNPGEPAAATGKKIKTGGSKEDSGSSTGSLKSEPKNEVKEKTTLWGTDDSYSGSSSEDV